MIKYETHVLPKLESVEEWVLGGLSEEEIAQRLGIGCRTLKKYKEGHEELREILCTDREQIIAKVEKSLVKRAMGYKYTEEKIVDKGDKVEKTTTIKEMAPDLNAILILLKTYSPEKWNDKLKVENTGGGGVVILPDILRDMEGEDDGTV